MNILYGASELDKHCPIDLQNTQKDRPQKHKLNVTWSGRNGLTFRGNMKKFK